MAAAAGEGAAAAGSTDARKGGPPPKKEEKFQFIGQVLAAIVVTAAAGSILGARRFRKTMTDTVSRNAQRRKAEERAAKAARDRANASGGPRNGGADGYPADGNPLRGRIPKGWEFDDSRDAAFAEQRLNSQVVQHLLNLGVKNYVAGSEEVKTAYRGKAMDLHPDRNGSIPKEGGDREFKKVAASYAWLDNNYFRKRKRGT